MSLNVTLPGENGYHLRDGSLLRKKQEQWAKERAEMEKSNWFPFGHKQHSEKIQQHTPEERTVNREFSTNEIISPTPSSIATTSIVFTPNNSFASGFENTSSFNDQSHSFIGQESEHQQERHLKIIKDSQKLLQEQIEERRRLEEALEEQNRLEIQSVVKVHQQLEEKQIQESEEEQSKWKKQHEKAYLLTIERAKLESEALRKAKLFKHILLSSDTTQDTAMKILGTNDPTLVNSVLKQLGSLEHQKRLNEEILNSSAVSSNTSMNKSCSTTPHNATSGPASPSSHNSNKPMQRQNSVKKLTPSNITSNSSPNEQNTSFLRRDPGRCSLKNFPTPKKASINGTSRLVKRSDSLERLHMNRNNQNNTNISSSHTINSSFNNSQQTTHENNKLPLNIQIDNIQNKADDVLRRIEKSIRPIPPPRKKLLAKSSSTTQMNTENGNKDEKTEESIKLPKLNDRTTFNQQPSYDAYTSLFQTPLGRGSSSQMATASNAMQFLEGKPNHSESLKLNQRRSNEYNKIKTIGLFEQVPVRQRSMFRQPNLPLNKPSQFLPNRQSTEEYDDSDFEHNQINNQNTLIDRRQGNSAGASSIATTDSSSPISTSPPLSNDKSISPFDGISGLPISRKTSHESSNSPSFNSKFKALSITPSGSRDDLANGNLMSDRRPLSAKPPSTPFSRKIYDAMDNQRKMDHLVPEQLRRTLRSPTVMHLQDTINGYRSGRLSNATSINGLEGNLENNNGFDSRSRPITPKPFNCRSSQYRSLNLKKDTDRQQRILEQLSRVRSELKERRAQIERCVSNQNLAPNGN